MLYIDTKTWLPDDDLLIKADKMTMANHSGDLTSPSPTPPQGCFKTIPRMEGVATQHALSHSLGVVRGHVGNTAPGRRTLIKVGKKLEAVMMTASVGLVMLLSPQRIVITQRKVLL